MFMLFSFLILNFFTAKCYFIFSKCNEELCLYSDGKYRSYANSFVHCSESGAWPVEITDRETSHLFESFTAEYFPNIFVFLNIQVELGWKWMNGKQVDLSKISFDHSLGGNHYGGFMVENHTFGVFQGNYSLKIYKWICSKNDETSCPKPFAILDKKCYFVRNFDTHFYYSSAENDCFNNKASLATFENLNENQIYDGLRNIIQTSNGYWVGLANVFRKWRKSGKPVLFSNWLNGKVTNDDCAKAMYDPKLGRNYWTADDDCNVELPVVCMKNKTKKPEGNDAAEQENILKILVIVGWVVAGVSLLSLLVFLACFIKHKTHLKQSNNSIPTRNFLYPINNPQPTPEHQAIHIDSVVSESSGYVENTNYYDVPNPLQEEDRKYTALRK